MVFMIMAMIFVLIFPTLATAMTGYAPVTQSFIQGWSGRLVPFSDWQPHVMAFESI
ncbi:hypothetical protein GGS26DRAFT_557863 [Hypomontagnella submonticulosa]|nr:hypothetical protein GGS26DRAFT_557863 [Hypomontagnella submonticulosa]